MDKALLSRILKIGGFVAAFAILFAIDAWLYEKKNTHVVVESELEKEYFEENSQVEVIGGDRQEQKVEVVAESEVVKEIKEVAKEVKKEEVKPAVAGATIAPEYQILTPAISRAMGFSFKYPTKIFKLTTGKTSVLLSSQYSFVSNFSGLANQRVIHNYSVELVNYDLGIKEALGKELPYALAMIYKDGKFVPSPGYAEKFILGGKEGILVMEGAEGLNMHYIFLPKAINKTLVIRFKYIGDILKPKLSEAKQKQYLGEIINSLVVK